MTDQTGVSEQHLDLTLVESEERSLAVSVVYREVLEDDQEVGDYVSSEVKTFSVRGSLPVPMMTTFLRLETRINNALATDDDEADRALEQVMEEAHRRIVGLIVERTPSAFAEVELELDGRRVKAKPRIELDVSQILVLLSWIAGDTTVADKVARALTAGRTGARSQESVREGRSDEHDRAEPGAEAAPATPLPSSAP